MIRLFLKQAPHELLKLQQALADENVEAVRQTVHKLKSSVAMIGAERMVSKLKQIESQLAAGDDCMVFWEAFNILEKEFTEVKKELEPMLQ